MIDTAEKISDLRFKSGVDFDKAFLEGMIEHHEDTIELLELGIEESGGERLISLSRSIVSDLERHLRDLRDLLGTE